jgi:hypothetical protein
MRVSESFVRLGKLRENSAGVVGTFLYVHRTGNEMFPRCVRVSEFLCRHDEIEKQDPQVVVDYAQVVLRMKISPSPIETELSTRSTGKPE